MESFPLRASEMDPGHFFQNLCKGVGMLWEGTQEKDAYEEKYTEKEKRKVH